MDVGSHKELLGVKIKILGEQQHKLQVMVDGHIQHIKKVLNTGQEWMKGNREDDSGKTLSFREISLLMEDTLMLMAEKCQHLEDGEIKAKSSQSETAGNIQTPVSSDTVKSVLSSIQVLEETVSSLSSSVKKDIDKQKKDFDSLKDHVEEKLTKKVEDLAQKVTKQEKAVKKFNKVEQRLGELEELGKQNLGKISAVEKKVERQKIKLENFEAVESQRENALESAKEKIEQLESSSISMANKVEDQESSIQEVTKTLERHSNTLENQKLTLQQLTSTVENFSVTKKNQESLLQKLNTTVEGHSETLEGCSVDRERQIERIREVQDRLTVLETEKTEALEEVGKQFADVKQKYEMVCEMVDDRVLPLERLREILNGKIKGREENVEKLHEVIKDVADLVPRMSQLEIELAKPAVAVTVDAFKIKPVNGNIIKSWNHLAGNRGHLLDVTTGMFTAPQDGVYGVCLTMWQEGEGEIFLRVHKTLSGNSPDSGSDAIVVVSITKRGQSGDAEFSLVDMKTGDRLYVCAFNVVQNPSLSSSNFSVFLIK